MQLAATTPTDVVTPLLTVEEALAGLDQARHNTLALVTHLTHTQLEQLHSPLMSPLVWDLGHIAAYEDLWLAHRHASAPLLRPDLAELYDAFETPRAVRGQIEMLGPPDAFAYLQDVRARVAEIICKQGVGDGFAHEMVIRHELQHSETMRQTMMLGGILAPGEPSLSPLAGEDQWVDVPGGPATIGAAQQTFSYDNERPRHTTAVPRFQIARRSATNESWMRFTEGGGYERREWWSDEGWAWKEEYDITHHPDAADSHPQAPVCRICWFEADAFARAHHARLPTEYEWEKAAAWTQQTSLAGLGQVWEWTSSHFHGYPGFSAHPYREYSEVFFGECYRVLRGGSWATHARVATPTFRNWDLPQRRQLFAGVRLAKDVR
ncbi:MAG TPA: SUMF1/EgtB/PvdO family nonheme iron enzyme [Solirubrobacteraceae bacterium]|nr:SUMF1/EgtB/PvdO family nonheme iron enzyme [Solirubrobacteraceae bacterium]